MEKKFLIGLVVVVLCIAANGQQQQWPQANHLISDGPFAHELVTDNFEMSRDFAFDGMGNVIGRKGVGMVLVNGDWIRAGKRAIEVREGIKNVVAPPDKAFFWVNDSAHSVHGQRFRSNGDFVFGFPIAKPQKGLMGIRCLHPGARKAPDRGTIKPFLMPQYVHTDLAGNIWYTGKQSKNDAHGAPQPTINLIGPPPDNTYTNIVSGAPLQTPRGIVYDSVRKMIFYTEEETHTVMALSYAPGGTAGKIQEVVRLPEGPARNVTLDQYGNLYACSGDHVYRLRLDTKGSIQGMPIALNRESLPRASSAQFGHGPGWDRHALYVMCEPENWKFKLGTVANIPEYTSYFYKIELGVAGDPDAQMDPSSFDPEPGIAYQEVVAERQEAYTEYLAKVDADVRGRLKVRNNPISKIKPFLQLAKLGATLGVGYNHDPMLMLNGKNLTGNEPELESLPALYADFEERRSFRAAPYGQHPATGWTFTISIADNPRMTHFDFLQEIGPMDIALDGCTHFSNDDLAKLERKRGLKRITLERTGVTIPGVADFLRETRIDYLRVDGVDDTNIEILIAGLKKAGTRDVGVSGDELTLTGIRKLAALPKLSTVTMKGVELTRNDITSLRNLMPKVSIRRTQTSQ